MRYALLALAAVTASLVSTDVATAQYVYVTGYAPAPVVPAYGAPVPVYSTPAPTIAYRPVAPMVAYRPFLAPRTSVVVAPPAAVAAPVVTTRYRPILGGSVTRVRYYAAPAAYVPLAY